MQSSEVFFLSYSGLKPCLIIGHPWPQPFGRLFFGNRPIRFSLPNCVCGNLPLYGV